MVKTSISVLQTTENHFELIQIMVIQVVFWGCSAILLCITFIILLTYILPHKPQTDYMDFTTLENIEKVKTGVYFEKCRTKSFDSIKNSLSTAERDKSEYVKHKSSTSSNSDNHDSSKNDNSDFNYNNGDETKKNNDRDANKNSDNDAKKNNDRDDDTNDKLDANEKKREE